MYIHPWGTRRRVIDNILGIINKKHSINNCKSTSEARKLKQKILYFLFKFPCLSVCFFRWLSNSPKNQKIFTTYKQRPYGKITVLNKEGQTLRLAIKQEQLFALIRQELHNLSSQHFYFYQVTLRTFIAGGNHQTNAVNPHSNKLPANTLLEINKSIYTKLLQSP